jgi:hypothetical protein
MPSSRRSNPSATVSARSVAKYLAEYVDRYRGEYARFTSAPPNGCGYPRLDISPYLSATSINAYITRDGCAIADYSNEPDYLWHIAGGPTLMVDSEPTEVPAKIVSLLRQQGVYGKNIGVYRLVAKTRLEADVKVGQLPKPTEEVKRHVGSTKISVRRYDFDFASLIARLTYGAIGPIIELPMSSEDFLCTPRVIRSIGMTTADRDHKRWFNYLELNRHVDEAAWDRRSIWMRVNVDVRRHFLHAIGAIDRRGGLLALEGPEAPLDLLRDASNAVPDKLRVAKGAIDGFSELLTTHGGDPEATFHDYLAEHPIVLDVYGSAESTPRFVFPPGQSPLGKEYVEPDFVIRYPGRRYKLVELERPSKGLATRRGEPRSGVTQAAFQIGEWKDFIRNHYEVLRDRYPGIASSPRTEVIISRSAIEHSGVGDVDRYLGLIREQLAVDDVITYDILLQRAQEAYARLSGAMV